MLDHLNVRQIIGWLLRLATAAALSVDAYAHADLVQRYDPNQSGGLSQGDLFRIEAAVAALAALLIVLVGRRLVWALAFVVAASALAAIMINANYDIGAIGPVPDMYEPLWYSEKTMTAYAEAIAAGTALLGFVFAPRATRRSAHAAEVPAASDATTRV